MTSKDLEQTLVLIKPDALKNSLTGYVLSQLSEFHTSLRFAGAKIVHVNKLLAEEHYAEHKGKVFFPSLIDYIVGNAHYPDEPWKRRVIAFVYQGVDAVRKMRELVGPTNPLIARERKPGCIRSLGAIVDIKDRTGATIGQRMDNLIHASASVAEAEREVKLWFRPSDIPPAMHGYPAEESDNHYYYKDGKICNTYVAGSVLLFAPGESAWKSDLEAARQHADCTPSSIPLEGVAAKYLINEMHESY